MTLKGLRLIEATVRPSKTKEMNRRQRLIHQINRQLQLSEAAAKGERVRGEWWWKGDDGKFMIVARYGRHHLELVKGKHAVVCDDLIAVHMALDMIKIAVERGEFDDQIEGVSKRIRANFRRNSA